MTRTSNLGVFLPLLLALAGGCARPTDTRPYVATLQLSGVRLVNARELTHGLAMRPLRWCEPGPHRAFDQLELDRDRTRVQRFYETKGYYATKVIHSEGKPRTGSLAVDVLLGVEEGPPTLIGDVSVFGIDGLDDKTRKQVQQYQLGLQRGQVFHHDDYLKFKASLTKQLKKHGYGDTVIEGVVDIVPQTNLANITIRLHAHGATTPSPSPVTQAEPTP